MKQTILVRMEGADHPDSINILIRAGRYRVSNAAVERLPDAADDEREKFVPQIEGYLPVYHDKGPHACGGHVGYIKTGTPKGTILTESNWLWSDGKAVEAFDRWHCATCHRMGGDVQVTWPYEQEEPRS